MKEIKIEYDSEVWNSFLRSIPVENFGEAALPHTAEAFVQAQHYVRNVWTQYLAGEVDLEGVDHIDKVNRAMIESIKEKRIKDFEYMVYSNNKQLEEIQHGSNPVYYDMKQTHPFGPRSRVSKDKDGNIKSYYLIIPFRWGTPNEKGTKRAHFNNVIPQAEYITKVKNLAITTRTGNTHFEKNAKGWNVRRSEYDWGGRLKDASDSRMEGMVRSLGYEWSKNGKIKVQGHYFTFRVISTKSPQGSWLYWKDGKNPIDMMGALKRKVEDNVKAIIETGMKADEKDFS